MRIISGSARGRKLRTPPSHSSDIRPTTDRARESLFSILGSDIVGSTILDLCAGTGAFGCEALSRGAASVLFVDNARSALSLIDENIALIPGGGERAHIIRHDLRKGLDHPAFTAAVDVRFNIVFADPPYLTPLTAIILSSLDICPHLAENPLVIIEEQKRFQPPDNLKNLVKTDSRKYGDSSFTFYQST